MAKRQQNSALKQVMDELNEESLSSSHTSPDLFAPELLDDDGQSPQATDSVALDQTGLSVQAPALTPTSSASQPVKEDSAARVGTTLPAVDAGQKPSPPAEDPSSEEELSELDNLLSFEPNKNRYEKSDQIMSPSKKVKALTPDKKKSKKHSNPPIDDALPVQSKKKVSTKGMINSLTGFYKPAIDPGISISLKQSENLRVAQERIVALEEEINRLRKENEELLSAGDIFKQRLDKITVQNDNLKKSYEESREEFQDEKKTLMDTLSDQSLEMDKMSMKNKELEKRLSSNIQQIRVRERELENRLELMKLDSQTLVREKDQYILDLKRQIDRIKIDLETQKSKYNETEQKLQGQKSQSRRASRGLQMALHILRGNDFSATQPNSEKKQ